MKLVSPAFRAEHIYRIFVKDKVEQNFQGKQSSKRVDWEREAYNALKDTNIVM